MEYTIIRLAETDSTNKQLKELWLAGRAGEGTAVLAERQTAGRGRLGRSFFSPEGGLYFSLLLRPRDLASDAGLITVSAAVALARACDRFLPEGAAPTKIKWVNDLYRDGRKIAGILAEAVSRGNESRVILGVGLNLTLPEGGFPAELREKAGALFTALAPEERENPNLLNHSRKRRIAAGSGTKVEEINKLPVTQRVPVIGIGGICTWQDAVEFIMAGATALQVGTMNFVNPNTMIEVIDGLEAFMKRKGYATIEDMRGLIQK